MAARLTWVSPDGGWGWVVVACSVVMHAQTFGVLFSLGVLYVSWLEEFEDGRGSTSWVISIAVAVTFLMGPLPAALANLYGFRVVTVVGGLLTGAGFILSYFATSIPYLIVTIGLITGTGCCFSFLSAVSVVTVYFNKRRPLAMGICTAGVGVGTLIAGPVLNHLIDAYGWRGAVLLTGAFSLHTCACGLLLRPLEKVEVCDEPCNGDEDDGFDGNISLLDLRNERYCSDLEKYSLQRSLENENMDHDGYCNGRDSSAIIVEHIVGDITVTVDQSNVSLNSHKSPNALCNSNKNKARSMMWLRNGSLLSVNKARIYCSLKDIHINSNTKHPELLSTFNLRDLNHQRSLDVIFARSLRQLSSVSPLGILPNNLIKHFDSIQNNNNSQLLEISHHNLQSDESHDSNLENSHRCSSAFSKGAIADMIRHNVEILRNPLFIQLALSNIATNLAFATPMLYLVDRAVDFGLDRTSGAMLVAMNGIGNIVGRLFFGALTYRLLQDSLPAYVAVLALAGISTAISPLCGDSLVLHQIYATLIGSFIGGYCTLLTIAVVDIMGIDKASSSFGLLLTFMGLASMVGPPFAGLLFDWTKNYTLTFIVCGILFIISALIILPSVFIRRRKMSESNALKGMEVEETVGLRGEEKEYGASTTCSPTKLGNGDSAAL